MRSSSPSLSSQAAEDQTSTAVKDVRPKTKNINRFPLPSENSTKKAASGTNKTLDLSLRPEHKPSVVDDPAYDVLHRCPQCDILLPLPTLNRHQVPAPVLSLPGCTPSGQGLERPRSCGMCVALPLERPFSVSSSGCPSPLSPGTSHRVYLHGRQSQLFHLHVLSFGPRG